MLYLCVGYLLLFHPPFLGDVPNSVVANSASPWVPFSGGLSPFRSDPNNAEPQIAIRRLPMALPATAIDTLSNNLSLPSSIALSFLAP